MVCFKLIACGQASEHGWEALTASNGEDTPDPFVAGQKGFLRSSRK